MIKRALTISRFQPFHLGHYDTIKKIREDGYEEIIVGIGSAEKSYRPDNPFTCGERIEMIHAALANEGFKHYFIVPMRDIDDYDLWIRHVVRLVPRFEVVYAGNPLTIKLFESEGYRTVEGKRKVVAINQHPVENVNVSGTAIREMIANDDERWRKLVPEQVCRKISELGGVKRVQELYAMLYQR